MGVFLDGKGVWLPFCYPACCLFTAVFPTAASINNETLRCGTTLYPLVRFPHIFPTLNFVGLSFPQGICDVSPGCSRFSKIFGEGASLGEVTS